MSEPVHYYSARLTHKREVHTQVGPTLVVERLKFHFAAKNDQDALDAVVRVWDAKSSLFPTRYKHLGRVLVNRTDIAPVSKLGLYGSKTSSRVLVWNREDDLAIDFPTAVQIHGEQRGARPICATLDKRDT